MILALLAHLVLAQSVGSPTSPQVAPAEDAVLPPLAPRSRKPIDRPVGVVHDRLITEWDWQRLMMMKPPAEDVTAPEDRNRHAQAVLNERIDELLQALAGRDMLDREMIDALNQRRMDEFIKAQGGRVQTSEFLRERGGTPEELRNALEEDLFRRAWTESVTGKSVGPAGRVSADRYVRPGQMYAMYQLESTRPSAAWVQLLGGEHERIVLQVLIVPVDAQGTTAALLRAKELAGRANKGEDFTQLVRAFSATAENDGLLQPHPTHTMAALSEKLHGDDQLLEFVEGARVGDISLPLLKAETSSGLPAVHVYRLHERRPAQVPDFMDRKTQDAIEQEILQVMDQRRLDHGMDRLRRAMATQASRGRNGRSEAGELDSSPATGPEPD